MSGDKKDTELFHVAGRRHCGVKFVEKACTDADNKRHGHQLYADPKNRFEVVEGHIRGPTAASEAEEEDTGVGHNPCCTKLQKHVDGDEGENQKDEPGYD